MTLKDKSEDSKRLKQVQMQLDDAMKMYHVIIAEAVKEFAEWLKEEQVFHVDECDNFVGFVTVSRIDDLVKEMVGEK